MDSKLQKRAIWVTILGVVFVLGMVLAVNWNAIRTMFGNMDILSENGIITETMNSNIQESKVENDYRSFLQDDNFFDKEIEPMTKVSRAPSLSLLVTSVEKDLRVEVLYSLAYSLTSNALTSSSANLIRLLYLTGYSDFI